MNAAKGIMFGFLTTSFVVLIIISLHYLSERYKGHREKPEVLYDPASYIIHYSPSIYEIRIGGQSYIVNEAGGIVIKPNN